MPVAAPTDPLPRLRAALERLVPAGDRLLLAVSGGSDSTALLALAAEAAPGRVQVAHVDHGLRAGSADDGTRVASLCADLGLPCTVLHAPPAPPHAGGSETAARGRRLAALTDAARAGGLRWVLTAHHLDDALETILLHLLRGHRGDRALAGIPAWRSLGPDLVLLRPFLVGADPPGRSALAAARTSRGLPCLDDPTNRDPAIPRNRLRAWFPEACGPLHRGRLAAARRDAIARLERRLLAAAVRLERHLQPRGGGALLAREALECPARTHAPDVDRLELLRLLGAALQHPRRLVLRRTILTRVREALDRPGGTLVLPGHPLPLRATVARDGLHLPHDPPALLPPAARALMALARTSLFP